MYTLQRYIFKELVRVLLLLVLVLTVLLVFVGVFQEATERGLGLFQALEIMPYIVPSMLPFSIPATLLLTVCVVYGRLAADYEITAAKAAGINVLSLLQPAIFLGTVLSVFSLVLSDQVIPWSMANIQHVVTLAREEIILDVLASQNMLMDPRHGVSITVSHVDRENRRLLHPNIRYSPRGREPLVIQAEEAILKLDLTKQEAILRLRNAWIDAPGSVSMKLEDHAFAFPLALAGGNQTKPRHLAMREIEQQLAEYQKSIEAAQDQCAIEAAFVMGSGEFQGFSEQRFVKLQSDRNGQQSLVNKHKTELHNRFAFSCSCFFFALIGSPFSILQARRQFLTTFFLCFVPILLGYYPIVLLMMNLSKTGQVNPAWAMWIGNLLLLLASGVILKKAFQH